MNLSQLSSLSKVGIGGVALGVVALILDKVIARSAQLPPEQTGRLLEIIAIGLLVLGGIALVVGKQAKVRVTTHGNHSPAVAAAGNVGSDSASAGKAAAKSAAAPIPDAAVTTHGDNSPAIVAGGNATLRLDQPQPRDGGGRP
jgi:hypothetical protein